mmetsp:Transcript_12454/g.29622  ORF Transcript_12454/g.29622 Transcript_12454/m.29622 type:complete len:499 (-) Transcript_12454:102-1598(-)
MDARSKEERDDRGRGTTLAHDPEKAAEKAALEAAFDQVMKAQGQPLTPPQPPQPPLADEQRQSVRVFSFTGAAAADPNAGALQAANRIPAPQEIDEVEAASPAFGRPMVPAMAQTPQPGPSMAQPMAQSMTPSMAQPKAMTQPGTMSMQTQWQPSQSSSMAMRPMSASRGGTVEDRLQHMEEMMFRFHEIQMRRQQEVEASIGSMFQEATQAMIPQLVDHMIEKLAQAMDFSELRDQLIESFSAVVDERSETILTSIGETSVVQKSIFSDVSRLGNKLDSMATSVNDLASNTMPELQDIFLDRFDELQRYVEMTMTNMDYQRAMPPGTGGGYDMSMKADPGWQSRSPVNRGPPPATDPKSPQRQANTRATTLPIATDGRSRRPDTAPGASADRARRHPGGQSLAHGQGSAGPTMAAGVGRTAIDGDGFDVCGRSQLQCTGRNQHGGARGPATMSETWPWQPRPSTPPPQEVPKEEIPPPLPAQPSRARPSDLFGGRKD